ncbi:MAG: hypothetical protein ACFNQB_07435 [Selenomonas noxia]|jgi:hypothetical protein|uniref:hypothetical protein n=1 Tax=Selenomonas noxia TaxID=135083 RepID=UPI002055C8F2|nr:hypothetical protein [Selenomonas noxia]DAU62120.1 MAG TPA: hypothetical protein [Caudoviricetes sp.]
MKKIEIRSGEPIGEDIERKIHDIFMESECPNESLIASIPGFERYDERSGIVHLVAGDLYTAIVFLE